jgi:hypothetical protein
MVRSKLVDCAPGSYVLALRFAHAGREETAPDERPRACCIFAAMSSKLFK